MTKEKELGYELIRPILQSTKLMRAWNNERGHVKDIIVEEVGEEALKLAFSILIKQWTWRSLQVGIGIGILIGMGLMLLLFIMV